ncbi:MAG: family transposase [Candidatus Berkelbacteria bacterium]|nr:family transposase [Candidatus Berkelbacteria bacterium]
MIAPSGRWSNRPMPISSFAPFSNDPWMTTFRTGPFTDLFNRVVMMAKEAGLLDEKLRIIDSSAIHAKVDVARHLGAAVHDNDDALDRLDRRSPDPDARLGHKTATKQWYGYKVHTSIDPSSDIVTAVETTSANVADVNQLVPLIDKERALFPTNQRPMRQVTADKAYVGRTKQLTERRVLDYIIPRTNMLQKRGTWFLSARKQRPKVERIFAEGKTNHHLGRCRYWTRCKTHLQSLLVFLTMNLKRLTNALQPMKRAIVSI